MNFEFSQSPVTGVGSIGIGTQVLIEAKEDEFISESFADVYETYGQNVLAEISRIKKVSREEARRFVDFSTFDEIVECLRSGLSAMSDLEPGILAMTFCYISTQ